MKAVDYSFVHPSTEELKAAGVTDVFRYVGPPAWAPKAITQAEYDELTAAGINVWLVFEDGANDAETGFQGGVHNGQLAEQCLPEGYPLASPVFVAVDEEFSAANLATALDYVHGFSQVFGPNRTGVYGEGLLISEAKAAGSVAKGWQSCSSAFPGSEPAGPAVDVLQTIDSPIAGTDGDTILHPLSLDVATEAPNHPAPNPAAAAAALVIGDSMFGSLAKNKQDDFFATVKLVWGMVRSDPITTDDLELLWATYNSTGTGGAAGSMFSIVSTIIDGAGANKRSDFTGAV